MCCIWFRLQIKIFGPDANIFYNSEIQDPRNINVVRYDTKNLVIHQIGHVEIKKETGEIFDKESSENYKLLNSILEKNKLNKYDYNILNDAVVKLKELSNKEPLQKSLTELEQELNKYGISDNQTIENYIVVKLNKMFDEMNIKFPEETKEEIIKRIIGIKGITINSIVKTLQKNDDLLAQKMKIKEIVKKGNNLLKQAIFPIEQIVHNFSVEMLKGLQSAFILDQTDEVKRLRKELKRAIREIEKSGDEDAIKVLRYNLNKIKNIENISTASEGFVFDYNGKVYKFTGNFAPLNQILGLFKYGKVERKEEPLEEQNLKEQKIGIIPGAFKPPHIGHYMAARFLLESNELEKVIILISPKSRKTNSLEVKAEQSLKIWEIYVKNEPKFEVLISDEASPVKATYNFMEKLKPGDQLFLAISEKDKDDDRFNRAQEWSDKNNLGIKVQKVVIPIKYDISGTEVRNLLDKKNEDLFKKYIPKHLSEEEKVMVYKILVQEELKEISAMSAGCIQGNVNNGKNSKKNLIKRVEENYMIKNEEEQKLREIIRKLTESAFKNRKKQKEFINLEEKNFRQIIKKMIVKEAKWMPAPHYSTGINILRNLLKQVIPVIEIDFKQLTSEKFQRDSYRSHIINAIEKTLDREQSNHEAGKSEKESLKEQDEEGEVLNRKKISPEKGLPSQESNVENGDSGKEEKFIDIEDEKEKSAEEKQKKIDKERLTSQEEFSLPNADETGRNLAFGTYQKIEKEIIRSFSVLSNEKDRIMFADYLITNTKMYFDKFEAELSSSVEEPTTKQYEKGQEGEVVEEDFGFE